MAAISASAASLRRLSASRTMFFLCDMQDRFQAAINHFPALVEVNRRLVEACHALSVPIICTEQYPKALGHTVGPLTIDRGAVIPKTQFSMVTDEVRERLVAVSTGPDALQAVVLSGIEAHVCVLQTALDLRCMGLEVHVIADGVSSRNPVDRVFAYDRMRAAGCVVTTSEAVIFELLGDAKHPQFKTVQALVKTLAPDTGLRPDAS